MNRNCGGRAGVRVMYDTSVVVMQTNRRKFLVASGLTALGAARAAGANDRIRMGAIGCGGRMKNLLDSADQVGGYAFRPKPQSLEQIIGRKVRPSEDES